MDMHELLNEIKRLKSLKEDRSGCTIDIQLNLIKEVIKAVKPHFGNPDTLLTENQTWDMIIQELQL